MRKQVEESNDFDSDRIKRKKADDSKDNANAANFAKKKKSVDNDVM